ncbi:MAG TPA: DNA mismatch repair protein MutS [Myxococcota bacterium]|nr:DNA mismatch repair protein MutS [Myxococcota bacterium]
MAEPVTSASEPRASYTSRLEERRAAVAAAARRTRWLSNARLAVFGAAAGVAWLAWWRGSVSGLWLLPLAAAFVALVLRHEHARRARLRAERAVEFYERGLARLELADAPWGNTGEQALDPEHPYASQLDLFGPGSLFALLSQAQTQSGEECLARWLLAAATPVEIRARQAAVQELRPRLALREDWFTLGPELREGVARESLVRWAEAPTRLPGSAARVAAGVAGVLILGLVARALATGSYEPALGALALGLLVGGALSRRAHAVLEEIEARTRDLAQLAVLLKRIEAEPFSAPKLQALRAELTADGEPASQRIAELHRWVSVLDWQRNQLFAPIAFLLLWRIQLAFALEAWRRRFGGRVARWLEALGELEALLDLAGYAYEHPADPFPELVEAGPLFEARGLGHPLLSDERCVRNDLSLDRGQALWIVSGSNMSGKSTFLRSVGVSVVMALAGAPVRAQALRLSPLALGAVMRVQDSLRDGASRFYAELLALRRVSEACAGPLPVLFLLDEILNGTNSHDRRIGAEALLRGLLARGAVGLVTTHDLALTAIADELAPRARNAHFEDQLENGVLRFDYRLRDGVIARGNALELMRAVGLDLGAH